MSEPKKPPEQIGTLENMRIEFLTCFHMVFPLFLIAILTTTANSWHKLQDSLDKAQMVSTSAPPTEGADLRLSYVSGIITTREMVREPFANTPLPYAAAVLIDSRRRSCTSRNRGILSAETSKVTTPVTLTVNGYLVWYSMINDNLDKLLKPVDLSTLPQLVAGHADRAIGNNTLHKNNNGEPFVKGQSYCGTTEYKLYYIPKDINVTLIGWLATDEKEGLVLTSSPLLAKGYDGVAAAGENPANVLEKTAQTAKKTILYCAFGFYALVLLQIRPLDRLAVPHNPLSLWRVNLLGFASTIMTVGYFDRISNAFLALLALLGSILLLYILLRVTQRAKKLPST